MGKKYKVNQELVKRDRAKYFLPNGDEGYVKKHNDYVMSEVIRKYEAKQKAKLAEVVDQYGERADAVVTYLKAVAKGKEAKVDRYFGKKYLAHLRGEEIRQELMGGLRLIKNAPQK